MVPGPNGIFRGSGNVTCDNSPKVEDELRLEKSVGAKRHSPCNMDVVEDVEVVLSLIRVVVVNVDSGPAAIDVLGVVDVRRPAMRACFLNGLIPNEMARRSIFALGRVVSPEGVTPLSSNNYIFQIKEE